MNDIKLPDKQVTKSSLVYHTFLISMRCLHSNKILMLHECKETHRLGAYNCVSKSHGHIHSYLQVRIADEFLQFLTARTDVSREPLFNCALKIYVGQFLRDVSI